MWESGSWSGLRRGSECVVVVLGGAMCVCGSGFRRGSVCWGVEVGVFLGGAVCVGVELEDVLGGAVCGRVEVGVDTK